MAHKIQSIRGMHDILPDQSSLWRFVEDQISYILDSYGYRQMRTPVLEVTELFRRSIGEATDIVEKEMYSFNDRNGDNLTLRPEGTAGCVRAGIEHGLFHNQVQRIWYGGAMFRHERPQKGRYRQFYQVGVEAFGLSGPDIDIEIILMSRRFWQVLGLEGIVLQINTLGTAEERAEYRDELISYLVAHKDQLDNESRKRLMSNPLRILDSKNPEMKALINAAPQLLNHLGTESRNHFETLCSGLDAAGVAYIVNPQLVRGLDYYNRTVFEWVTDQLGAQGTVCAGGRYDGLVEQLGGRFTPAIGFAIGLERLIALFEARDKTPVMRALDAYLVLMGDTAQREGLILAEELRNNIPGIKLMTHCGGGSLKSQFKKADRSGARYALILGENELARGVIGVKSLRVEQQQQEILLDELAAFFKAAS